MWLLFSIIAYDTDPLIFVIIIVPDSQADPEPVFFTNTRSPSLKTPRTVCHGPQ